MDPNKGNQWNVRLAVMSTLVMLLLVTVYFAFVHFKTPVAPKATTQLAQAVPTSALFADSAQWTVQSQPTFTYEPTPVPTPSPDPTPRPSPTPRPTEIKALRRGDKSEEVRALQQRLIELSYLKEGSADGNFGKGTMAAIQKFQQNNGLAPDGVAGRETIAKIFSADAQ